MKNIKEDFIKEGDTLNINFGSKPSILEIIDKINVEGPILLRFPHLIKKQLDKLYNSFYKAKKEFSYSGKFNAVFPLKVNHFPNFINSLVEVSKNYNYGFEAGSKAELLIAISKTIIGKPIIVNGFKDKNMINLCFIAVSIGHNLTIIIEGINELEIILNINKKFNSNITPKIGARVRLHSSGEGVWKKSGGYNSKFGLTSIELIKTYKILKENNLLDKFYMIHFHIGSQIKNIFPFKKALREAGNIFADLKNKGAFALSAIDIGGGLAVEYSTDLNIKKVNYSLIEFSNDIIFLMKEIAKNKGIQEPDIFIEAGRFISSNHCILVTPALELFSQEYEEKNLSLKNINPPLIEELYDLYNSIKLSNAYEYLHDSLDYMESLLTLFDLGYIDLEDRANTEILVHLIIKKALYLLKDKDRKELLNFEEIEEKYLINFSSFQSFPDFWGLQQNFPIYPINKLDLEADNPATIWDITCDSNGEIPFNKENPLYLHSIDLKKDRYFLAIFLVGAYQEVLAMNHNLFSRPTEATVNININNYHISNIIKSDNIKTITTKLGYSPNILFKLKNLISNSNLLNKEEKKNLLSLNREISNGNNYLKIL